jgi:hypothetical protein
MIDSIGSGSARQKTVEVVSKSEASPLYEIPADVRAFLRLQEESPNISAVHTPPVCMVRTAGVVRQIGPQYRSS